MKNRERIKTQNHQPTKPNPSNDKSNTNPAIPSTTHHLTGGPTTTTTIRNSHRQILTQNPKDPPPHRPSTSPKHNPPQNPHIKTHRPPRIIPADGAQAPIPHEGVGRRERGAHSRPIPLALFQRRDSRLGQKLVLVKNGGDDAVVRQAELLVGVVDGEPDDPVAGDGLGSGGGVEVGEREGIDRELGNTGAKDKPDDEDDRAANDEEGDYGGEEAAEEGGA